MSYTLVKISGFYPGYIKNYYERFPCIAEKSYSEQLEHLMQDSFGWADYFSKNLRAIGVNAHEIVFNVKPLQHAWARENNIKVDDLMHILKEQLRKIKPDVLFVEDAFSLNGGWIEHVRNEIPSIRQVIGWCAVNYTSEDFNNFKPIDYMLSCTPGFRDGFIKNGKKAYLLNHAFEITILDKIKQFTGIRNKDMIFIGSIMLNEFYHLTRLDILRKIYDNNISLEIYSDLRHYDEVKNIIKRGLLWLNKTPYIRNLVSISSFLKTKSIQSFPIKQINDNNKLFNISKKPVYGIEMFKTMSNAKICFNNHIDAAGDYAGNMRLFEATGVGSCLLTDHKKNIFELFEPDKEIVTYKNVDECVEKTLWLLNHDKEREEIAMSGQKRVLNDHTYFHRAQQLNEIIMQNF